MPFVEKLTIDRHVVVNAYKETIVEKPAPKDGSLILVMPDPSEFGLRQYLVAYWSSIGFMACELTGGEWFPLKNEPVSWKQIDTSTEAMVQESLELFADRPTYGIIDPDYARVFTKVRCIAWQEGYAAVMNGSFTRDLDILLVPWENSARKDIKIVIARILDGAGLKDIGGPPTDKPHGRKAWTFAFKDFGDPRFIDISAVVVPEQPYEKLQADLKSAQTDLINFKLDVRRALNWEPTLNDFEEVKQIEQAVRGDCAKDERTVGQAVGQMLKALRKEQELTQFELADKAKLNRTSICQIETGRQHFSEASLNAIANALGYDAKVVFIKKPQTPE